LDELKKIHFRIANFTITTIMKKKKEKIFQI